MTGKWLGIRPYQRHSLVLMCAGVIYIAIGLTYALSEPTEARRVALQFAEVWMPIDWWGAVFMIAGGISIVSSRWPPFSETWGYTVLSGLSAGWAAFYGVGIVLGHAPAAQWTAVQLWGLIALLWWAISGLLSPPNLAEVKRGSSSSS